jgi:hypothetical protein
LPGYPVEQALYIRFFLFQVLFNLLRQFPAKATLKQFTQRSARMKIVTGCFQEYRKRLFFGQLPKNPGGAHS